MKYYKDSNGKPITSTSGRPLAGYEEIENPILSNGTLLPKHKGINALEKDAEGKPFRYYKQDGKPDTAKINTKAQEEAEEAEFQEFLVNEKAQEMIAAKARFNAHRGGNLCQQ